MHMHFALQYALNDYESASNMQCKRGMHFVWEEREDAKWIFSLLPCIFGATVFQHVHNSFF
jgi:hypothetical protein